MTGGRHMQGFTLLELLVSVAIFAIMAGIIQVGLVAILDTRAEVDAMSEDLMLLQRDMLMLERDLAHAVARPSRDSLGDTQPAWSGGPGTGTLFTFTRSGWPNPAATPRSELLRLSYVLDGDRLLRLSWVHVDGAQADTASTAVMLEGTRETDVRFLTTDGQWVSDWPPADAVDPNALPRAVQLNIDHPRWGPIQRLLQVGT